MMQIESAPRVEGESAQRESRGRKDLYFLVPIVLVNVMALAGQAAWGYGELVTGFLLGMVALSVTAGVLLGLTLESIGVWLMLQAHDATMEGQASGSLRLSAYGVSGIMAVLNWAHWSVYAWEMGVGFALLSMVSPFLWSVRAKRAHFTQLAARGLVDPAGVKLSTSRQFWHPFRSLSVRRWAAWSGESNPQRAVEGWERESLPQSAPLAPLQAEIERGSAPEMEGARPREIERETAQSETVTETETVTRTVSRQRSVSRSHVLQERVAAVRERYPDWERENVTYAQIGELLSLTGSQTLKNIRDALYAAPEREMVIDG